MKPLQITKKLNKIFLWSIMTMIFFHFLFSFWIIANPENYGDKYTTIIDIPIADGTNQYIYQVIKRLITVPGLILMIFAFLMFCILLLR